MMGQKQLGKVLKGVYSALVSFLGGLSTVLVGTTTMSHVTPGQWVSLALFGLVSFGGVYGLSGWSGPSVDGGPKA